METKISELEKENRQLKNALQRSDEYVEDLEKQIVKISDSGKTNIYENSSAINGRAQNSEKKTGKIRFIDHSDDLETNIPTSSTVKRALFGETDNHSVATLRRTQTSAIASNNHQMSTDHLVENRTPDENDAALLLQTASQMCPESIMKHSGSTLASKSNRGSSDLVTNDRKSKKVKFDIQGESTVSSSFDLEMPSPFGGSQFEESASSSQKPGKFTYNDQSKSTDLMLESKSDSTVKQKPSSFDDYIINILEKTNVNNMPDSSNTNVLSNRKAVIDNDNVGRIPQFSNVDGIKEMSKSMNLHVSNSNDFQSHDSSHLSMPDLDSSGKSFVHSINEYGLQDRPSSTRKDEGDFNMSMTPELSDCLQLMAQAEQKLEKGPSSNSLSNYSDIGVAHIMKSSQDNNVGQFQLPKSGLLPMYGLQSFHSSLKPKSSTSYPGYMPSADVSWKQQFYSSLSANPYKLHSAKSSVPPSQSVSSVDKTNIPIYDDSKSISPYSDKHNFSKEPSSVPSSKLSSFPSSFSSSIPRSTPLTNNTTNTNASVDGASLSSYKHFNSMHADHQKLTLPSDSKLFSFPSADHVTYPVSAPSQSQPLLAPSSLSSSSSSYPSLYGLSQYSSTITFPSYSSSHHTRSDSLAPSISSYPLSSSSLAFNNPLPPSLNNSALEWPDDSPQLSMPSSSGKDFRSSDCMADTLPLPPRDVNSLGGRSGSYPLRSGKEALHNSYINSSNAMSEESSLMLPEPKKRLFNNSFNELELPSSPVKTKI